MEVGVAQPFPTVPSPTAIMNCGASNNQQQHDTELDSLVIHRPQQRPSPWIGAGLDNMGNTCFLNAVVQCLVHTVPLIQALQALDHRSRCSCDDEEFCSLCAFQSLMGQCLRTTDGAVEPELLANNLSKISSSLRRYQQEDAHEFLLCLLDSLENAHNKRERKDEYSSKAGNFLQDIFGGRLQSQVKCCSCGHISHMFEPMVDLSLEIEDSDTLTGALESFTNVEKMNDPDNKLTCESCKEKVFVDKQLKIDRPPEVIQLHLKRFKNDGYYSNKIDKFVEYPAELDLAPYVVASSDEREPLMYDLYAVLVHDGWSAYSGHYYCVIRSSKDTWHRMDDSEVHDIKQDIALDRHAYVLFYVRQGSSVWFSSLLKEGLGDAFNNVIRKETSPSSVLDIPPGPWVSSPEREDRGTANVRLDSVLDDKPVQSWIEQMDRGLRSSASPDADAGEPGISGSSTDCSSSLTKPLNISKVEDARDAVKTPPRAEREDDVLRKVFDYEQFDDDDDDKENFLLVRPGSGQTTPVAPHPVSNDKESGGSRSRNVEILNSQMRQMPSGRRRALLAHIPPSHSFGGSENRHKKKQRTHDIETF